MKRSFESGYTKRKKTKEQEERIKKLPKLTFFSKTTADTTSTCTSTSRLVYSIAEEKE
jgi:hypothetical protein